MQTIFLVDFGSVRPQMLGVDLYIPLLSMDRKLIVSRKPSGGLWFGASDEGIGGKVLRHDKVAHSSQFSYFT